MTAEPRCVFCERPMHGARRVASDVCRGCRSTLFLDRTRSALREIEKSVETLQHAVSEFIEGWDHSLADGVEGPPNPERPCVFCERPVGAAEGYAGEVCLRCRLIALCRERDGRPRQVFWRSLVGIAADYRDVGSSEVLALSTHSASGVVFCMDDEQKVRARRPTPAARPWGGCDVRG